MSTIIDAKLSQIGKQFVQISDDQQFENLEMRNDHPANVNHDLKEFVKSEVTCLKCNQISLGQKYCSSCQNTIVDDSNSKSL